MSGRSGPLSDESRSKSLNKARFDPSKPILINGSEHRTGYAIRELKAGLILGSKLLDGTWAYHIPINLPLVVEIPWPVPRNL